MNLQPINAAIYLETLFRAYLKAGWRPHLAHMPIGGPLARQVFYDCMMAEMEMDRPLRSYLSHRIKVGRILFPNH